MRAWERQEGETQKAFEAFKIYRDLGPERTLDKSFRIWKGLEVTSTKRASGQWKDWSVKHDWVDRVNAMDDRDEMVSNEAIEKYITSRATEVAQRQAKLQDKALDAAGELADRLLQMSKWPVAKTEKKVITEKNEDGSEKTIEITIFNPAKWSFRTAFDGLTAIAQVAEAKDVEEEISKEYQEFMNAFNANGEKSD